MAGMTLQLRLHLLDAVEEVRAHAVELVDVGDARHVVLVGLEPDGFATALRRRRRRRRRRRAPSRTRRERSTSAVKSTWPGVSMMLMRVSPHSMVTAALLIVMPFCLFERVEVGGGVAVVDVADLVLGAAEVQDALRGGGFARVDVSDDADVAKVFKHGTSGGVYPATQLPGQGKNGPAPAGHPSGEHDSAGSYCDDTSVRRPRGSRLPLGTPRSEASGTPATKTAVVIPDAVSVPVGPGIRREAAGTTPEENDRLVASRSRAPIQGGEETRSPAT